MRRRQCHKQIAARIKERVSRHYERVGPLLLESRESGFEVGLAGRVDEDDLSADSARCVPYFGLLCLCLRIIRID